MNRAIDKSEIRRALSNSAISGAMTGIEVDGKGFGRARFIFTFGQPLANGSLVSAGVWVAGGTDGASTTYSSISSAQLTARSSLSIANQEAVIDVAIPKGSWGLKVSGAIATSNVPVGCVCELYEPIDIPPSHSALETVAVN